jgi:hypothetical protein
MRTSIALTVLIFVLSHPALAQDDPPPGDQFQTNRVQGVTAGTTSDTVQSTTSTNASDVWTSQSKATEGFRGAELGYRFNDLSATEVHPGVTLIRRVDLSAQAARGSYQTSLDSHSSIQVPCWTDQASGAELCGLGGDPTGNTPLSAIHMVQETNSGSTSTSHSASRYGASGTLGYGAILGSHRCGPYAGGNIAGHAERTNVAGGSPQIEQALGLQGEAGLGCLGSVLTIISATVDRGGTTRVFGEGHTDLNNKAYGAKVDVATDRLRVGASAAKFSDDVTANTMVMSVPNDSGYRYTVSGSYRLQKHLTIDGQATFTEKTDKTEPVFFWGDNLVQGSTKSATVRAVIGF